MSNALAKTRQLLAVPNNFRETALSFPEKIEQALALINDVDAATEALAYADMLASYAARVKADTGTMNGISYGRLLIIARIGELSPPMTAKQKGTSFGRGKKIASKPTLLAISKPTLSKYRKVSKNIPKAKGYLAKCGDTEELTTDGFVRFATGNEKAGRAAHVSLNSGIPEWYTPSDYIEAAREVLGEISLDPASSDIAQETIKAKKHFTVDDDGLSKKWAGNVWLNPPYTSDLVNKFVPKLCQHIEKEDVKAALLLVNNATETKWFQQAATVAQAICFPSSRIKFLDENGKPGAPLQGQAVLYFGKSIAKFVKYFQSFGFCVEIIHGS